MKISGLAFFGTFLAMLLCLSALLSPGAAEQCIPTEPDSLGPFYKPGAPERSSVGKGYVLSGSVKSARDCSPVRRARIEFWLTGPDGTYDDRHRATVYSDNAGNYHFESNTPKEYVWRPPHIHILVSADDFKTLVTQHYPVKNRSEGIFDIVLIPAR
jgi:protocatechuate 3,4-dioxygenase beta subunit